MATNDDETNQVLLRDDGDGACGINLLDSDSDGIAEGNDFFPCDSTGSAMSYNPACGVFGTIMFEDSWPDSLDGDSNDMDYNDFVIRYNYAFSLEDNKVTELYMSLHPQAMGSQLNLGLSLSLPEVDFASIGSIYFLPETETELLISFEEVINGIPRSIIPIINDVRSLFDASCGSGVNDFINTDPNLPVCQGVPIEIIIDFTEPVAIPRDGPLDLFIVRPIDAAGQSTHEIHLPNFPPTLMMPPDLVEQAYNEEFARFFVNQNGLPFALETPAETVWPTESTRIESLYPNILSWAVTGGSAYQD